MVFRVGPVSAFWRPPALSEMDPDYRLYKHSPAPLPFARPVHIFLGPYMAAGGRGCVLGIQHRPIDSPDTKVILPQWKNMFPRRDMIYKILTKQSVQTLSQCALLEKAEVVFFLLKYFTIPPRSSFPETEETRSGSRELASPPYAATCSSFVVLITGQARSR